LAQPPSLRMRHLWPLRDQLDLERRERLFIASLSDSPVPIEKTIADLVRIKQHQDRRLMISNALWRGGLVAFKNKSGEPCPESSPLYLKKQPELRSSMAALRVEFYHRTTEREALLAKTCGTAD
jgi:hypothetical protein